MKIKVLIADDHSIVREGLRMILESQPDIEVVGEAREGREAIAFVEALMPDVVIMDISMPGLNGIEAARVIHTERPSTKIIMLSMYYTAEYLFRATQAGAQGYILKESAGPEIIAAIHEVMTERQYYCSVIKEIQSAASAVEINNAQSPLERLSNREREVLQLVVEGKTSVQIAAVLALSPKSVETYRSRMMQKLGISDIPSLVKFAIQHGVTTPT